MKKTVETLPFMTRFGAFPLLLVGLLTFTAACNAAPTAAPANPAGDAASESGAAGTGPTTASGAEGAPALTSKELNIYSWSEYIPEELRQKFESEFGVRINYDTYSSNEELLAKLQAGGSGYDLVVPSDYMMTIMIAQNMLEPIDSGHIPNLANVDDRFKSPSYDPGNRYSVPYQWGTTGIAVNSTASTKAVTKFADLWDPAFKDNLVVVDDSRELLGMTLTMLGKDRNSRNAADLQAAKAKLIELKPNIKLFNSDSPKTEILAGEVVAGVVYNGEAALAARENSSIQYVLPEDGCGIWYDNLAIPKGAPHPDVARAFVNFALSPAMSLLISRDFPYSNPNKAGLEAFAKAYPDLYKQYMASTATNPPDSVFTRCQPIRDVGDALPLWDQMWTEFKNAP